MYCAKKGEAYRLFSLDMCETCGSLITAANSLTVMSKPKGVTELEKVPDEGWYDEDSGMEVCPKCVT
jgi:hypothetical protein